jgi:hypothetical protein
VMRLKVMNFGNTLFFMGIPVPRGPQWWMAEFILAVTGTQHCAKLVCACHGGVVRGPYW